MADQDLLTLSHSQLIEVLLKHSGIHEGNWALHLGLLIGTGTVGPPGQAGPGVVVTIQNIGIQRQPEGSPIAPDAIVVDASKANPPPKRKRPQARAK